VFHALRQAEVCLTELDNRPVVRHRRQGGGVRLLGRARSELEFLRPEELLDDLSAQLLSSNAAYATSARPSHASTSTPRPWVAWTAPEVS
jgi:hypothetical protein